MKSPAFSVVIPSYNRAYCIADTIRSVLKQDFSDFEILVVDDGSSDNTQEVVEQFTDSRIRYYKKTNGERGAARNFGTAHARGEYINFFDSDDLMYPNHLHEAYELITRLDRPEFFHLAYDYILQDGTLISHINNFDNSTHAKILFDNRLSCNGVFLRKDVAKEFPFVEDRTLASSEDWELWIRLICRFHFRFTNTITSAVVNHDQRSLRTIQADKVVARDLLLIRELKNDPLVMERYGDKFHRFVAERYTFFMLSMAEEKRRRDVWKWAVKAFRNYPLILGSARFLASIKNSILK